MADSMFGDIAKEASGAVSSALQNAPEGALSGMSGRLSEVLGPVLQSMSESGSGINEQLAPLLESLQSSDAFAPHALSDVVDATPDSAADAATSTAPAAELNYSAVENLAGKIDELTESAMTKVSSSDAATAAQGQLEMQQLQQVTETVMKAVQQQSDMKMDVIEGLHGDAGIDETMVVAVADSGDTHTIAHADTDAGYDQGSYHATDYATDHAPAAPMPVETPPADDDGVA